MAGAGEHCQGTSLCIFAVDKHGKAAGAGQEVRTCPQGHHTGCTHGFSSWGSVVVIGQGLKLAERCIVKG